jgi:hypothetical protein
VAGDRRRFPVTHLRPLMPYECNLGLPECSWACTFRDYGNHKTQ